MKSVNLIPPDARRSDRSSMRTGGVPYVVLIALGLLLLGVISTAFASRQVSEKEAEVTAKEKELQATTARAQALAPFTEFGAMEEMRSGTVASLAQSRFDWERVLNELALIIPSDVWLVEVSGTASPAVQLDDATEIQIRDSVAGPALELIGCGASQDAVAGFVADLEDIDGVTRVGLDSSLLPEDDTEASGSTSEDSGSDSADTSDECRTRRFIARFEIVVAFDAVPVPGTATAAPTVPPGAAPGSSEVADAQAQQAANSSEVAQASGEAQQATDVLPGG